MKREDQSKHGGRIFVITNICPILRVLKINSTAQKHVKSPGLLDGFPVGNRCSSFVYRSSLLFVASQFFFTKLINSVKVWTPTRIELETSYWWITRPGAHTSHTGVSKTVHFNNSITIFQTFVKQKKVILKINLQSPVLCKESNNTWRNEA